MVKFYCAKRGVIRERGHQGEFSSSLFSRSSVSSVSHGSVTGYFICDLNERRLVGGLYRRLSTKAQGTLGTARMYAVSNGA